MTVAWLCSFVFKRKLMSFTDSFSDIAFTAGCLRKRWGDRLLVTHTRRMLRRIQPKHFEAWMLFDRVCVCLGEVFMSMHQASHMIDFQDVH